MKKTSTTVTVLFLSLVLCCAAAADPAREIVAQSGVQGGLIVQIGCGDGSLTTSLKVGDSYVVHALDVDAADVDRARRAIQARGVYGAVSVHLFDGVHLPYAENLVNLLIADAQCQISRSEVMRVLVPGGVAIVGDERIIKPVPSDIDEWTHWLHGPDGNAVARDRVVGPPRRIQWMARPYWARLHDAPSSTSAMVSSGGRVFYISDEGPAGMYAGLEDKWFLIARDAYNGILLWKRPMPDWGWKQWTANWHARNNQPFQLPKRLVAVGDRLYVTLAFNAPVSALDAATGNVVKAYKGTERADEILVDEGRLILSVNRSDHDPSRTDYQPLRKSVVVVEADTGRVLWRAGDYTGLAAKTDSIGPDGRLELAAGDGRIFLSDHDAIVALDLETGAPLWRTPRTLGPKLNANFNTRMYELPVLVYSDGVVLYAQPEGTISFHSVPGTLYAYDARDGGLLWRHRYGGWVHNTQPNVFVIDGTVWIHEHQEGAVTQGGKRRVIPASLQGELDYAVLGLDLRTGRQKSRLSTRAIFNVGHHHRCYRNKATERFLLTSRRGVEFLEIVSGDIDVNHWTRGDCQLGIMPCNGLLYTTPHPCSCYIDSKLNGYFALAPAAERPGTDDRGRSFVKGPAWGATVSEERPSAEDWWTFRANAGRSGSAATRIAGELVAAWKAKLGAASGPVSVAGQKVFAPVVDQHRLMALDAATGATAWEFVAGARIDTPPTICGGMALFGAADGWVYALLASDGQLMWKRRVAPAQRLVGARGQLESAWPLHGSVLVHDGIAYVAAGRSSFLDGGIRLCALQPRTGEILKQHTLYTPDPKTNRMAADPSYAHTMPGTLADILVADQSAIWMRNALVFGQPSLRDGHVYASSGFRDDSWFNRTTWKMDAVAHAQLLVFDASAAYAIEAYSSTSRAKAFAPGGGYRLFARSRNPAEVSGAPARRDKAGGKRAKATGRDRWSVRIPVRATAMALAGDTLLVAGAPDIVDPTDPLGALEGRRGSRLCAFSTADGSRRFECPIDALPVWDGMAVARGKLFLATQDGAIWCFRAS